jgi:hypothetical protein
LAAPRASLRVWAVEAGSGGGGMVKKGWLERGH